MTTWWKKHFRDPKPGPKNPNLCSHCMDGYPVETYDGDWYCDKQKKIVGQKTECAEHDNRYSSPSICMSELIEFQADYEPVDDEHTCGECVRYDNGGFPDRKPWCHGCYSPENIEPDRKACKIYLDRKEQEQKDREERKRREQERHDLWRKNESNPPRPAVMRREVLYDTGELSGEMLFCPNCEEPLYNLDQCYFCGQKILMDDALIEWVEPPEEHHMDCLNCGGKGTMVYVISGFNGHKHGTCSKCGASFME